MSSKDQEKYKSEWTYRVVQFRRALLKRVIQRLVHWEPLQEPKPGYTIIIGCNTPLARMLGANLLFVSRQDLRHVDRILIVFDRPRAQMPFDVEPDMRRRFPSLPLEFVYWTQQQSDVVTRVKFPWVNSWLSWSLGIGMSNTQHVLLQDFDAMLLRRDIIEERYQAIRERGHHFVGIRFYKGNGVIPDDGLASTFELMLDAQWLRRHHKPIAAFNQIMRYKGRRVDFDTLLYCQTTGSQNSVLPIAEEDMVHPSQVICQFEEFNNGRSDRIPPSHNLPFVPYFHFVGGAGEMMEQMTEQLEKAAGSAVPFFNRPLNLAGISEAHLAWITKQAYHLEIAAAGGVRVEVRRYFDAISQFVARANGRQPVLGSVRA